MNEKQYRIKEIFYSIQGEGAHSGMPAVFVRFSGCNLWNGDEAKRANAICNFCDTDFVGIDGDGGGKYSAVELSARILEIYKNKTNQESHDFINIICTGGEPCLQLDINLLKELKDKKIKIHLETNGTFDLSELDKFIDWVTFSPKNKDIKLQKADEIKFVYPQKDLKPEQFNDFPANHFYIQPIDLSFKFIQITDKNKPKTDILAVDYCLKNPKWHLSAQIHKNLNIR